MTTITTTTTRKKVKTIRACNKDGTCPFLIQTICQNSNSKWYIKAQNDKCNGVKVGVHYCYLQIQSNHNPKKVDHMDPEVHTFIHNFLKEPTSLPRISSLNCYTLQYHATR